MEDTLDTRLAAVLQRRTRVLAKVQRVRGKLEASEQAVQDIEAECRSKGVEPDQLDATIQTLTTRYQKSVEQLEREVADAEQALAPFEKEV
jgi:predicted HicB family RNase H-like nuclease